MRPSNPKLEKERGRQLRQSRWWQNRIQSCSCYYCECPLDATTATMDHVIPLSRGGRSTKGNVVPSCKACNTKKHSSPPWEMLRSADTSAAE